MKIEENLLYVDDDGGLHEVLQVGDAVYKPSGYPYPGVIRSVFYTTAGKLRYVVEATGEDYKGMLHIFSPSQLEVV